MFGNGARELVVHRPVFDPAAGQAGEPENHAGENGEKDGAAVDGIHGLHGVFRSLHVQKRRAKGPFPDQAEDNRASADGDNVAECGGKLGTDNTLDVGDQFVDPELSWQR